MINTLFLAGGRRVQLGHLFSNLGCKLFAYELEEEAPLAEYATIIKGKKWDDSDFPAHFLQSIKDHDIDLIIPLDCRGVYELSKLNLSNAVVSSPKTTLNCLDKIKFEVFMMVNFYGENYPLPIEGKDYIIKPRFGFGSNGVEIGYDFNKSLIKDNDKVYQLKVNGKEYSVDAYFNKNSKMVGASVRERIWVSGGEVIETQTIDYPELIDLTKKIGERLSCQGPICCQFIEDEEDEKLYVIENNCRAGGGSTVSCEAGLNIPKLIIDEYIYGLTPKENSIHAEVGVYCSRSFKDHYFRSK